MRSSTGITAPAWGTSSARCVAASTRLLSDPADPIHVPDCLAAAAVNWSDGENLLARGIAGSGNTTVLVARAARLATSRSTTTDPCTPTVRLMTFTHALAELTRVLAGLVGE